VAATEVDAQWSEWLVELFARRFGEDGNPLTAKEVWHIE
jgi:hypothetical protein